MMHNKGFNIVELTVAVALVAVATCLLIACFDDGGGSQSSAQNGAASDEGESLLTDDVYTEVREQRRQEREEALTELQDDRYYSLRTMARMMQNNTQLRGLHQSMVIYAQSNKTGTSEGQYPGLDENGEIVDGPPEAVKTEGGDGADPVTRYAYMLDRNLFSGDYAISPIDYDKDVYDDVLSSKNYSYAMLRLTGDDQAAEARRSEWAETLNSEAAIATDRNVGASSTKHASIWTHDSEAEADRRWEGSLVWNDNHAIFAVSPTQETRYESTHTADDHLFSTEGVAEMVYSDSSSLSQQH